jgi:hypothetical protein
MAKYLLSNEQQEVVQYPYTLRQMQLDNPKTSFPRNVAMKSSVLADFYVFPVTATPTPSWDPRIQTVEEVEPELIDGVWTQRWEVRSASPQEQAVTNATLQAKFSDLIQKRLDDFAQTRNYSSILTAVSYENDSNPKFAREAADAKRLRSETWTTAYIILAEVEAGTRPVPSTLSDIEADLPVLEWTHEA